MAVAEVNNIVIEKGTDFEVTFNLFDPDLSTSNLTGITTTFASIRKFPGSLLYEEFSKTITTSTGIIKLSLSHEQTSRLTAGRNYFDVAITLNNKKIMVIRGTAIVMESVSL